MSPFADALKAIVEAALREVTDAPVPVVVRDDGTRQIAVIDPQGMTMRRETVHDYTVVLAPDGAKPARYLLDGVWFAPHWLGFSTRADPDARVYDFWARGMVGEFAVRNAGALAAWKARRG